MGVLLVRDEWIQDLELMGNDLLIYARLYSFTQNVGAYRGSMEWLAQSVGATRKTAERTIDRLIERNLVKKEGKKIQCFVYDAELEPEFNELYQKDTKMGQNDPKMGQNDPKMGQNDPKWNNNETPENKLYQNDPKMGQNDPRMGQNDPQIINIKENQKIKGGGECAHTHARTHEGEGSASTTPPPPPPFFVFYLKSKIHTQQDYDDAVTLSELMNEEQAKIFHSWVMGHKAEYHIGFYLQHWCEFLDKAIEWSAKKEQAQYKQKPTATHKTPQPPQVAPADTPTATDTNATGYPQWRAMVADVVAVHPNTSHKDYFYRMRLTNHVAESLPQTATKEQITEFITANTLQN